MTEANGNVIEEDVEIDDDMGNRVVGAKARAVVEHIVASLVEYPDEVDIEFEEHRGELSIAIHANPNDMGRLIGRRGRVIQAVRQVVRAAAAMENCKVSVDVAD